MFNLFKRFRRKKWLQDHLAQYRDAFTDDERKAILIGLLVVANSDENFHTDEQRFFAEVAEAMEHPLEEDFIDDFFEMDRRDVFKTLNALSDDQKAWYATTLFAMIHMDGKSLDVEFERALPYLEKMGISNARFREIIRDSGIGKEVPEDLKG